MYYFVFRLRVQLITQTLTIIPRTWRSHQMTCLDGMKTFRFVILIYNQFPDGTWRAYLELVLETTKVSNLSKYGFLRLLENPLQCQLVTQQPNVL